MLLNELSATQAAAQIAIGEVSSEDLVRACLARIAEREPAVRAFAHVAAESAIRAARDADTAVLLKDNDKALRPLHGVPVAIKDIIETADMSTEYNSRIYRGHQSGKDAACVAILRSAGAIVLGKTETIEFAAHGRLPVTRNPHDLTRTPGGSSSGSAAAVADMMVPLTLGTQTGGSVIRPASFCGVYGFKPTWASVNPEGAKLFSVTLDTIGWYGRHMDDIALLARLYEISSTEEPALSGLKLAYYDTPYFDRTTPDGKAAFRATIEKLRAAGASLTELELGDEFAAVNDLKERVMRGEGRTAFLHLQHGWPDLVSPGIKARMGRTDDLGLRKALDESAMLRIAFDKAAEPFDAVLTPAATGVAPEGQHYAGDPIFNGLWTLLHVPCLSLPVMTGEKDLPIGLQLVGPRYTDMRVIAAGRCIVDLLK